MAYVTKDGPEIPRPDTHVVKNSSMAYMGSMGPLYECIRRVRVDIRSPEHHGARWPLVEVETRTYFLSRKWELEDR